MDKVFSFVVVGSGNICKTYFMAIEQIPQAQIVGVVSRNLNQPDFIPQSIEIKTQLSDIQSDFDAVILATPNGLHHLGAVEAASLGKHVLTEKPLDISISHMDKMISACENAKVKLGVSYQHRTSPDNKMLKKLIDSGEIGTIFSADYTVRCWRDENYYNSADWRGGWEVDGGGPFIQQACHEIDLYIWFFGVPEKVHAFTNTFLHKIEVEDHGAAIFRHHNGMIGTFVASTVAWPGFPPELTIHTSLGTIILINGQINQWHIKGIENPTNIADKPIHSGASSASVKDVSEHIAILNDFIEAVQTDSEPIASGKSAKISNELILKIYDQANRSGL